MNCKIRIYDKDFNWIGEIENAESVWFERKYYGIGGFEIHIHPDKRYVDMLERNNFIVINKDNSKLGIIKDFELIESRENTSLTIYGETAKGFTKQRIIEPPSKDEDPQAYGYDRISGSCETIIKHYLNGHMANPKEPKRKFSFIEIGEDKKRGKTFNFRARYENLGDIIEEIAEFGEMGWTAFFNGENKKIIYEIVEGTDRTINQNINSPVSFKMDYRNIGSYNYIEDTTNYKTTAYAGGGGEDENRLVYTLGSEYEGVDRLEVFVDCGNVEDIKELKLYGEQRLGEYKEIKSIEAEALPRAFEFNKDYFLGDKVSLYIDRLDIWIDERITEVKEIWERELGYKYEIKFGYELPNLYTKLKNKDIKR